MPSAPDYSQYIAVKKISTAQTANANIALVKGKAPNIFDGYFPLYKGIRLPANALLSNKFTAGSGSSTAPVVPFSPNDITGLSVWLDATDLTTGANVTTWTDKTSSARVFTKGGTTPVVSLIGGLKYVDTTPGGASTGGYFSNASFVIPSSLSVFVVGYSAVNTIGLGDITALMSCSTDLILYMWRADGTFYAQYGNGSGGWNSVIQNSDNSTTSRLMEFVINSSAGGSSTYYTNGTSRGTASGASSNGTFTGLNIGSRGAGTNPWRGYIGEVLFYNGALIQANREKIEGYMAWKWGLVASLPIGHPYKTAAP